MVRKAHIFSFALLLIAAGLPGAAEAQERCISGRDSRPMLESQQVAPFPDAARRAGIPAREVQGVRLCQSGGNYVYEVDVVRPRGRAQEKISAEPERRNGRGDRGRPSRWFK